MFGRNKGDPLHNKENKNAEQSEQGSYYKGEKRSGSKKKEETAYSKALERKLEKIEASNSGVDKKNIQREREKPTIEQSAKPSS
ncbi:14072_t:CDS:2 [Gigaspora rosea]|nr:14072_t:CDS:2 [Gigaspora rosea]